MRKRYTDTYSELVAAHYASKSSDQLLTDKQKVQANLGGNRVTTQTGAIAFVGLVLLVAGTKAGSQKSRWLDTQAGEKPHTGVKVQGYITPNATVYPVYQTPKIP